METAAGHVRTETGRTAFTAATKTAEGTKKDHQLGVVGGFSMVCVGLFAKIPA